MGEITNQSYTSTFKGEAQPYTNNAHGGYYPTLGEFGKLQSSEFSATVAISFKKIDCENKLQYARYIKRQLAKSGRLWAVQNGNEIIYANARVTSINENVDNVVATDVLNLSINFELIDGYWIIPSTTRTFLCDYCPPKFQDFDPYYCYDVNDLVGKCDETGTSRCFPCLANLYKPVEVERCDGKALCYYTKKELFEMLGASCPNQYFITYSCELERAKFCFDASWGAKFRLYPNDPNNYNVTRISFCSKTDLPTEFVRIRLSGTWNNPNMHKIVIRKLKPSALQDENFSERDNKFMDDKYLEDSLSIGNDNYMFDVGKAVVTTGYGIKTYYSYNMTNPDSEVYDIPAPKTTRTNTPFFKIDPGINVFEISGNIYGDDAFAYFQPLELTF